MDYEEEIWEKLGKENVDLILNRIRQGDIGHDDLKVIGRKMHPYVYGELVHVHASRRDHKPEYLFRLCLDKWYNESLCKRTSLEAKDEFMKIIQDVEGKR